MNPCKYEEDIGYIKATLKSLDTRVNGSMDKVKRHIEQGAKWRVAIVGIIFAGIVQVVSFAYLFGQMCAIVKINSKMIDEVRMK